MSETVVVLGASEKPDRYSNKAQRLLTEHGHRVIPVHPLGKVIEGIAAVTSLKDVTTPVDTLTLYVGPERSSLMIREIVELRPGRVIFNPGTENPALEAALDDAGIPWIEACTLVMLRTGQY